MVSTATPAARANSSIRYSTSDHSNGRGEGSAAGRAGRTVAQADSEGGQAGAALNDEGDGVAGLVELDHPAQGLAVVEIDAVDLLDHVAGPVGRAAGHHAADHDPVALDRGAAVAGEIGGQVLVADAHVRMARPAARHQVLGDALGDPAGDRVADAVG